MYVLDGEISAHHQPPCIEDRCVVARAQPHTFLPIVAGAVRLVHLRQEVPYQIEFPDNSHLAGS